MIRRSLKRSMLILLILIPLTVSCVSASDEENIINEQMQESGADELYTAAPEDTQSALSGLGIDGADAANLANFTPAAFFNYLVEKVKDAATAPIKAVAAVFGILLVCSLLSTLKNSIGEKPLKTVFNLVCMLCIAAVMLVPISKCITGSAGILKDASVFMLSFIPVFIGLVTASGHPASAVTYQSLLLVSSETIAQLATTTFIPLVNMYLAFCVIGSISPGVNIGGIAGFIRKFVSFVLGLCITVFTGILTVQGLISQAADNVTIKTAKFVVGNAVPVVGKAISDAVNTVVSCANLLKTTTGVFAIVVLVITYLTPLLNCILWMLAADLSIALAETLGNEEIVGLLKAIKEALLILIALILACAITMVITVSVILLLGMND